MLCGIDDDGFISGASPMLIVLEKEHWGFDDVDVFRKKVDLRAVEEDGFMSGAPLLLIVLKKS